MFSLTAVAKSSFRPIGKLMAVSAISVAALSAGSTVSSAAVFQFILHDHPDGALANPTYGLRLDDLYGGNNRYFTFSFDAPGTGMTLLYDDQANTVRIVGRARGGIDVGGSYDPNNLGFVDIDFTYRSNLVTDGFGTFGQDSTNLGLRTTDHDQNVATGNSGTITLATGVWGAGASEGDVFTMVDQSNGNFSFKLNNFSDHRLSGHPRVTADLIRSSAGAGSITGRRAAHRDRTSTRVTGFSRPNWSPLRPRYRHRQAL